MIMLSVWGVMLVVQCHNSLAYVPTLKNLCGIAWNCQRFGAIRNIQILEEQKNLD